MSDRVAVVLIFSGGTLASVLWVLIAWCAL